MTGMILNRGQPNTARAWVSALAVSQRATPQKTTGDCYRFDAFLEFCRYTLPAQDLGTVGSKPVVWSGFLGRVEAKVTRT
jgi:hypothetical protein